MRVIVGRTVPFAVLVWFVSGIWFQGLVDAGLPITRPAAPVDIADRPNPGDELAVMQAVETAVEEPPQTVFVTGALVNLRAGPGLCYRMITVAEIGDRLRVSGRSVEGWLPVIDLVTGAEAWIDGDSVADTPPTI